MSDRMIICSKPECQTTAGCKCGWEMGEVSRWPAHTYNTILDLRATIIGLETELREQQNRHNEEMNEEVAIAHFGGLILSHAEIERLKAENYAFRQANEMPLEGEGDRLLGALVQQMKIIKRLREALKPFADAHFYYNDGGKPDECPTTASGITYGDFRQAVAALSTPQQETK
jgi:hypothetical protein